MITIRRHTKQPFPAELVTWIMVLITIAAGYKLIFNLFAFLLWKLYEFIIYGVSEAVLSNLPRWPL